MNKKSRLTQILPSTRWRGRLHNVSDDLKDRITAIAMKAYRRNHPGSLHSDADVEPIEVIMAVTRAKAAAENYISEKQNEMPLREFRSQVGRNKSGSLRQAVDQLTAFLVADQSGSGTAVSDALPPFAQMKALFCYDDPNANGLEDADDATREMWNAKTDLWKHRYGPGAVQEVLAEWQSLMDSVHAATGKTGRPPVAAEIAFVSRLAYYWTNELRAIPTNSRGLNESRDIAPPNQQSGLFADFVRTVSEMIPAEYQPSNKWDHAIRTVVGRKPPE